MFRHRFKLSAALAVALLAAIPAHADGDRERERERDRDDRHRKSEEAYRARHEGKLVPLAEIMQTVRRDYPGQILETEYETDKGVPVYEFYVLGADGVVREIKFDGRTGKLIEISREK